MVYDTSNDSTNAVGEAMAEWKGQVAVITGAASGIGAGLARHALALGMEVYAADVDSDGLAALGDYPGLHCSGLDVTDSGMVEAFADGVFAQTGRVNLLFNNAGVLVDGKSWERSTDDWRWCLEVNVMGVVHGIRSFVPRMLAQQAPGRVINTSSVGGLLGGAPFMAPYQGTKHCITAITESLHQELLLETAPITASVLCPGEVATGIWQSDRLRPPEARNTLGSETEQAFHQQLEAQVAAGMPPEEFAARVFAGIEAGRFWLLPGEEFKPVFQARCDSVMNEVDPAPLLGS